MCPPRGSFTPPTRDKWLTLTAQERHTKSNILIPRAINTVALCKTTSLTRESGTRAQIPAYGSCGIRSIHPVLPRRAIRWSNWQKRASAGAQLMRFQLAGAAKRRGGEAANSPSRRDLGASKYPPRAKRAKARASSGPLPLSLSWASGGNNSGGWSWQHEKKSSINTHLYSRAQSQVSRYYNGYYSTDTHI